MAIFGFPPVCPGGGSWGSNLHPGRSNFIIYPVLTKNVGVVQARAHCLTEITEISLVLQRISQTSEAFLSIPDTGL